MVYNKDLGLKTHPVVVPMYMTYQVSKVVALLPYWTIMYGVNKEHSTWSLGHTLMVKALRRMHRMVEATNTTILTRDPSIEPKPSELKDTEFRWIKWMSEDKRTGVLDYHQETVKDKVGTFIWKNGKEDGLVAITLHGGGYIHLNAHEKAPTSIIPKKLFSSGLFSQVYSVEYTLVGRGFFLDALLDVVSVIDDLIVNQNVDPAKIVVEGDSAGGHLSLAVARYMRDEKSVKLGGLLLLSPWCDPSIGFPLMHHEERPNSATDYLAESKINRAITVERFMVNCDKNLGDPGAGCQGCQDERSAVETKDEPGHLSVLSPYISPSAGQNENIEGLFSDFPKTFISYGGLERLVNEVETLIRRMKKDSIDCTVNLAEEGVHDILILTHWNEEVRRLVWEVMFHWLSKI